jgi:hypothetical protein
MIIPKAKKIAKKMNLSFQIDAIASFTELPDMSRSLAPRGNRVDPVLHRKSDYTSLAAI